MYYTPLIRQLIVFLPLGKTASTARHRNQTAVSQGSTPQRKGFHKDIHGLRSIGYSRLRGCMTAECQHWLHSAQQACMAHT
jgi:hypothetical protein